MLDLKNCPFCDRAANVYHAFPQFEVGWTINCDHDSKCILRQAHGMFTCEATAEKAVAAWNRRALQAVGPEPAVAVKPLAWNERGFAHTSTGIMYRVTHQPGSWVLDKITGPSHFESSYPSEETAKANAEADYAFRIRSALVAAPPAERVVEVAAQYAERLANVLWEKHYRNAAPDWKPLTGDLIGIITQIDNMTSGLALATKPAVKDDETVVEAAHKALVAGKMLLENSIGCAVNHYGDDYYIHGEPGWLADCRKDFEALEAALAAKDGRS